MKMLRFFCFVLILTIPSSCVGQAARQAGSVVDATDPVRILFIGNSLTYFNDLPAVLEQVANHDGTVRVNTAMIASGGATLNSHWDDGSAVKAINNGGWDYVVLQEQSQLGGQQIGGESVVNSPDDFFEYSRAFDAEIKNTRAQTVFMLTWAHKDKPEEQAMLNVAYSVIARKLDAVLIPAGKVWHRMRNGDIELYYDNVHPNLNGTYLTALVVGMTLVPDFPTSGGGVFEFNVGAEEPPASVFEDVKIAPEIAAKLQQVAREFRESSPSAWLSKDNDPVQ